MIGERMRIKNRRPVVYLASPYTRPDPVENVHTTIQIATRILEEGWCVPWCQRFGG
jgi:hypothetical protein